MTLGDEGKRDKQYQSQLNFGGSLPISMKIGKENIKIWPLGVKVKEINNIKDSSIIFEWKLFLPITNYQLDISF